MAPERVASLLRSRSTRSSLTPPRPPPPALRSQTCSSDGGLIVLRYEKAIAAKPPIAVTVPPPRQPPHDTHPALRTRSQTTQDDKKRDSGLAPTTSSKAREGSVNTVEENVLGFTGISINFNNMAMNVEAQPDAPQLEDAPAAPVSPTTPKTEISTTQSGNFWRRQSSKRASPEPATPTTAEKSSEEEFSPITTPIPTESFLDDDFLNQLTFSKRGSVMFGGKKAVNGHLRQHGGRRYVVSIHRLHCY
jgi:hypothetical protein